MSAAAPPPAEAPAERQRIDLWLLYARIVKTRPLAQTLASSGHVRVNGQKIDSPGRGVRIGDVLTIALARQVRVLRIAGLGVRRGPAPEARLLYEPVESGAASSPLARGHQSG